MKNLLIVDDEKTICNVLQFALEKEYNILVANNLSQFEAALKEYTVDIALVDLRFGRVNGLDLVRQIKAAFHNAIIIMITAYGSIQTSIQAIKNGAYDYILKPIDLETLRELLRGATQYQRLQQEALLPEITRPGTMIGTSPALRKVADTVEKIKDKTVDVLIMGESGTGKELVAREIHYGGRKKERPFVVVNCAAIPQTLIESELFGYEKGAFTGADKTKKGAFELADGGTIFLDEIGELDLYCQAKLLRAIQQKEITPLGAERSRKVDVRVIAVTNRMLHKEVEQGTFRRDLYYRLGVVTITVPPLSERAEDIPLLVAEFIAKANRMYGLKIGGVRQAAMDQLTARRYPGNIRELENMIYRACIMAEGDFLEVEDIQNLHTEATEEDTTAYIPVQLGTTIGDAEKQIILQTLEHTGGNKAKAAKVLGMSERSLYYKLKSYSEESER